MIELVFNGQHAANGLLVTESGYVLTSQHCVEDNLLPGLKVKDHRNKVYEIEKVHVRGKGELDIALIKADIPQKDIARQYRFYDLQEDHFAVAAFGRRDGLAVKKYGFAKKVNRVVGYNFPDGAPGDSGGMIATPNSEIMAVLCGKTLGYETDDGRIHDGGLYPVFAVPLLKTVDLINFYKRRLESRL